MLLGYGRRLLGASALALAAFLTGCASKPATQVVLLPQAVATIQAIGVPNRNTKQAYRGVFLSFNLRLNLPPPCTTGRLRGVRRAAGCAACASRYSSGWWCAPLARRR